MTSHSQDLGIVFSLYNVVNMNEMSHGFLINAKFENAKYFCTPYIVFMGLLVRKLRI